MKAECAPGRVWRLAYLFYRGGLSRESDCEKGCLSQAAFRFCRPCKPGSVLRLPGVPIIYLGRRSPGASSNLPPGIGRATLDCRYTWSCNPRDVLSEAYRYLRGGLLPRLFTLTPAGRLFSVTLAIPSRISSR